jgi:hypothetical protein
MKKVAIFVGMLLFIFQCTKRGVYHDFFLDTKDFPKFNKSQANSYFGLDSMSLDSISTSIDSKNYWYLNSANQGLFNIAGYIRNTGN